uniref:Uncharacterized protein n=1 Tax=Entomoneis paludosa TaxID=265537 RepID=A0A6U2Z150_9STRA|mmetsp:Transcript_18772/g.38876  ORF Transcript_18772/g.38876 Transcript_18772/m.38876 type:complete len:174 (+) Transcript_18772:3981-4502(+)
MQGGESATRCPAWHVDYVPVRWIQTLVGPGCWYLNPPTDDNPQLKLIANGMKANQAHGFFGTCNEDDDTNMPLPEDWKERLVAESGVTPQQAATGQAVLLVGKAWPQVRRGAPLPPVLHRSPHDVPSDQARVLLTLDVVLGTSNQKKNDSSCQESGCDCTSSPIEERRKNVWW